MTGYAPTAFTYPFGTVSEDSYPVLEELGFRATLDAQGKPFRSSPATKRQWWSPSPIPLGTTGDRTAKGRAPLPERGLPYPMAFSMICFPA